MPQIQYTPAALPGIPRENAFEVSDETGMKQGSAVVIEYVNHTILPERPLNFFISLRAHDERAFDMLMGAALARAIQLRAGKPRLRARIYAPCRPHDTTLLRGLQAFGFHNDDAVIRMRRILADQDRPQGPPVGCTVAPVLIEDDADAQGLLSRVNAYSVVAQGPEWIARLRQEQMFSVVGVWQEARLLGEVVLTAYGAEGRVEMLYTRPEFRRRGVASALVSYVRQVLLGSGIRSLTAEVWRRNLPAMAFFSALRFDSVAPAILYPGMDV